MSVDYPCPAVVKFNQSRQSTRPLTVNHNNACELQPLLGVSQGIISCDINPAAFERRDVSFSIFQQKRRDVIGLKIKHSSY